MRSSCSGALYGLGLLGGGLAQTTTSFFFGINDIGEQTGSVIGSSGDRTTMVLGCATSDVACVYPLGQASWTVTAEPSSFIFSVSGSTFGFSGEQTSQCTGTGSPITTGSCTLIGVESGSTSSFVTALEPILSPGYYQTIILNNNPGTTTAATTSPPTTQVTSATTAPKSANAARKTDTPWPIIAGAGAIAAIIGL